MFYYTASFFVTFILRLLSLYLKTSPYKDEVCQEKSAIIASSIYHACNVSLIFRQSGFESSMCCAFSITDHFKPGTEMGKTTDILSLAAKLSTSLEDCQCETELSLSNTQLQDYESPSPPGSNKNPNISEPIFFKADVKGYILLNNLQYLSLRSLFQGIVHQIRIDINFFVSQPKRHFL